ncbi:unnamed protein product, partial [Gongylonema pulchrum]|uniref:CBFD_NFYB_HMF domain-containing protein n=1 Tax=Gongylonema pulchrum TaxID=637853 RepID=A0A183EVV8_9BILA
VRRISPPPPSSPQPRNQNKVRSHRHVPRADGENASFTSSSRIETIVAQVVEKAAEYARRYDESAYTDGKQAKYRVADMNNTVVIAGGNEALLEYEEDDEPEYKVCP